MVGARFRRNKAKPRRRLLLIRAAVRGMLRSQGSPMPRAAVRGAGALGGVGPTGPRTARQPTDAAGGVGCRSTHRCRGRHGSAKDMGGARAWRRPLLPSCASGPDGCGAVGAWQDMRSVHDSRGACSEKGPFAARSSRSVFPDGCLRGFSDT